MTDICLPVAATLVGGDLLSLDNCSGRVLLPVGGVLYIGWSSHVIPGFCNPIVGRPFITFAKQGATSR